MIDLLPACGRMTDLLANVADDQLGLPTPCVGYTVRDLLAHVEEFSDGFATLAGAATEPATASSDADWRDYVAGRVRALGAAWRDPDAWRGTSEAADLDLPNELWGRIALTEVVVHGWDLAEATGQPLDMPEEALHACLEHVTVFVPNAPVPELWGPVVELSADAPLVDRLVALTGRRP